MPHLSYYKDNELMYRHVVDEKPNNDPFYMHIHDQFELLYFIRGTASCTVETTTFPLLPETLVLIAPMMSHRITILESEPYERYTINFSFSLLDKLEGGKKLLEPFYDRATGNRNCYHASEFSIPPKKLLAAMADPDGACDRLSVLTYFYALLGTIGDASRHKEPTPPLFETETLASRTADYINARLFDDLSVQSIAKHFYVSVSQLNRQFKKATGFPIWEYIIGKRLVSARNLIREGVPATHAYTQCGFNDYSSFYRLYAKRFGVSPKADTIGGKVKNP